MKYGILDFIISRNSETWSPTACIINTLVFEANSLLKFDFCALSLQIALLITLQNKMLFIKSGASSLKYY